MAGALRQQPPAVLNTWMRGAEMAKRTAAVLAVAVTVWVGGPAWGSSGPLWPCEVTVSIEAGPWRDAAVVAVDQLDDATGISWPIVESGGMVSIGWADLDEGLGGLTSVGASEVAKVGGRVDVDPSTSSRWVMPTLLHEVGHVAGLDHNDEARSVMNLGEVPYRRFQAVDLDALADVRCR